MPVLPLVGSTIVRLAEPGFRMPCRSAAWIIEAPIRHLTE